MRSEVPGLRGALSLLDGTSVIIIDNIEKPLVSPSLTSALTATTWTDQRLGTNEPVTVSQRATRVAMGNNVQVRADFARRRVLIRLDAQSARLYEEVDEEAPQWSGFFAALHTTFSDRAFTTAEAVRAVEMGGTTPSVLPADLAEAHGGGPSRLGWGRGSAGSEIQGTTGCDW